MREDCIRRKIIGSESDQFKAVVRLASQKAHLDPFIVSGRTEGFRSWRIRYFGRIGSLKCAATRFLR